MDVLDPVSEHNHVEWLENEWLQIQSIIKQLLNLHHNLF